MHNKIKKNKGGYSLIELIFYISVFCILTIAIINSFITMGKAFKQTSIQADLVQSSSIMERISREIRQSSSIFSISGSDLKLNTKDELDNAKTVRFVLSGYDVQIFENDILVGNLNTPNIQVTGLSFVEITTTMGKAVKVDFSTKSTRDQTGRVENFYNTIVLRGNY